MFKKECCYSTKVNAIDPTQDVSGEVVAIGRQPLMPGHYYVTGGNQLTITMKGIPNNLVLQYKAGTCLRVLKHVESLSHIWHINCCVVC